MVPLKYEEAFNLNVPAKQQPDENVIKCGCQLEDYLAKVIKND